MRSVVMHNVVSVDGFIADVNDDVGPLFDWYSNGDTELMPGFRVSRQSFDYVRPTWDGIGSMIVGRHLFDLTNGWEGRLPVMSVDRSWPSGRSTASRCSRILMSSSEATGCCTCAITCAADGVSTGATLSC